MMVFNDEIYVRRITVVVQYHLPVDEAEAIMYALSTNFNAFNINLSAAMYRAQAFGAQYSCTRPRETGNNLDKEGQVGFILYSPMGLTGRWKHLPCGKAKLFITYSTSLQAELIAGYNHCHRCHLHSNRGAIDKRIIH